VSTIIQTATNIAIASKHLIIFPDPCIRSK
jgi:hypothetical protein